MAKAIFRYPKIKGRTGMPRSGIYKCLNNSELAYYFAGRVACQPLFFRHSAWGQYGGDAYATAEGVEPFDSLARGLVEFILDASLVGELIIKRMKLFGSQLGVAQPFKILRFDGNLR